MLTPSQCRL